MEPVKPGKYLAKVVNYGIGETKAGNPQACITFSFIEGETNREMTWYGFFTERTIERTIDSLLICGMKGNDPRVLVAGPKSNALDMETEVSIVVENDKDDKGNVILNDKGQPTPKIRWVNRAAGTAFKRMDEKSVFAKLGDLKGLVASRRNETGIKDAPKPTQDNSPSFEQDLDF
jgi:hypothetical protein